MMNSCICDSSSGNGGFAVEKIQKARKGHRCYECGNDIKPGEKYELAKVCSDGSWNNFKTCLPCRSMRNSLMRCWTYGLVYESICEHYGFWPNEVPKDA